ncbi:LacI family transcriptional regulator [Herbaspirillum sp. RTI4]|uniref:LacI family transcriptional regulator n=1 Tax=Herbaspirillum sp. RTI4 TaxID=3048640 RepID=UPI002AB5A808|nr:LacI family transcriptional regulator [Herbaspirillum sp. RTI4]MDY7576731.1 LacI family transcriptional regulator [Herbaspirillum sp. RTI4]MDY7579912.1 LacI family transcriptional regulator [Herbaspirillum sp. RTI4]MEA9983591.1 LacI family transcriptional regulator [Herbaspirillum sp. RTI4]
MRPTTLALTGEPLLLRSADGAVTVSIPIRIQRYSGRCQIIVPPGITSAPDEDPVPTALQSALARGHRWLRQIDSGAFSNLRAIVEKEKLDPSYISRMVNLTTLAPDIVAAILDETLPESVSLFDLAVNTPLSWEEQRAKIALVLKKTN